MCIRDRAKHVRRWRDVRYYNDGRMERLDLEQPDLVLLLVPVAMCDGPQAPTSCRKIAALILQQKRSGRHVAFYGNPR